MTFKVLKHIKEHTQFSSMSCSDHFLVVFSTTFKCIFVVVVNRKIEH